MGEVIIYLANYFFFFLKRYGNNNDHFSIQNFKKLRKEGEKIFRNLQKLECLGNFDENETFELMIKNLNFYCLRQVRYEIGPRNAGTLYPANSRL